MKAEAIAAFVDRHGDRTGEVVWEAAMVLVRRAGEEAIEAKWGRWRAMPELELRRLRNELAHALSLAHLAVAMQEDANEHYRDLTRDLTDEARVAGRRARERRERTLDAQAARLRYAQARREGREPTPEERFPRVFADEVTDA